MVTCIYLDRNELITKEKMESFCKGEEDEKDSVNDDLETLIMLHYLKTFDLEKKRMKMFILIFYRS